MSPDAVVQAFGPAAAVVIVALAGVVVFLYRDNQAATKKYDDLQEKRYQESVETRDKLTGPINELKSTSEKMYEAIISIRDKKS